MCVDKKRRYHVINNLKLENTELPKMKLPHIQDQALEGRKPDVLVIGGGISGASIARELMKWKLDVLLAEKESDVAMHASGRNDGEVHPRIDLGKGTLKQHYVIAGNRMYGKICKELDVPFKRCGQYVGMMHWSELLPAYLYACQRKYMCGVSDTRVISGKTLRKREPHLNPDMKFAIYNSMAGSVCPYGLTIAYAENAVQNGAEVALNTAVLSMDVKDGKIRSVLTNRGRIYPEIVINAAGVFAEDVAKMAAKMVSASHPVKKNESYNPYRKGVPRLREMSPEQRNKLIQKRPDYGVMICRCEEISKGEIVDALCSPLPVYTVDGVKKRVRPGMGRCQGGFCMPLVAEIISEVTGQPLEKVKKSGGDSYLLFGKTKAGDGK